MLNFIIFVGDTCLLYMKSSLLYYVCPPLLTLSSYYYNFLKYIYFLQLFFPLALMSLNLLGLTAVPCLRPRQQRCLYWDVPDHDQKGSHHCSGE